MHGYYYDSGPGLLGWLIFAILVALLVVAVYAAGAHLARPEPARTLAAPAAAEEPLALLRLRYARGEISRDDFLQASADLGGSPPATGG